MKNNNNLNNNTMNSVEKRKASILKKRQKKEASKKAYYEKHKSKIENRNEAKAILQAGSFYSELLSEKKIKSYFINCKIDYRIIWYSPKTVTQIDDDNANILTNLYFNKFNKNIFNIFETPKYYINGEQKIDYNKIIQKSMYGQYIEHTEFSKIYDGSDMFKIKQMMIDDIYKLYTTNDQYKRQDILDIYDINILEHINKKNEKYSIKKMKMKEAKPLKYPELVGHIEDEINNNGLCVFNNFLTQYPHIKEEEFIKLCSYVEPVNDKSEGISSEQLLYVCKKKDISIYAFDVTKKCFIKYVSKNRNYKALVYYAINNHMYLVNDEIGQSLIKSSIDIETKINSIFFDEDNEETKNIFNELEIKENIEIKELLTYNKSCIVIYPNKHLYDQLIELMNNNIKPNIRRCKKTLITHMIINKSKKVKFYLFSDENDKSQDIDYKLVKNLCKKEDIEFKNQTFTSFITQLKNKKLKEKNMRINFNKEFRKEFFKNNSVCNNKECNKKLKKCDREIDHIIPLCNNGTNDLNNLQALCKECHFDKTQDDINDENINISQTHSSFNNSVAKILDGSLNKNLAFVEKVRYKNYEQLYDYEIVKKEEKSHLDFGINDYDNDEDFIKKQPKSSAIDINGCRRNILRFNKYDYPLFTCLDSFEIYKGQTGAGLYYIETNNFMPLRGNGLYYYPMVEYCLDNKIIETSNIKLCLLSSLKTPSNYFNDFIDYCVDNIDNYKLAINSLIGSFAINKDSKFWKSLLITENLNEAWELFFNNNGTFINMQESERGIFYNIFQEYNNINIETEKIIYDMILQIEAIELHKLKTIIENKGCQVTQYKTDCITYNYIGEYPFKLIDEKNIDGYFYEDGSPKYKIENYCELKNELKPRWIRTDKLYYNKSNFNIIDDVEDNDFKPLINKILNLNGCAIEGIAGSGKSTLINELVKEIKNNNMDVNLLTPTNLSSIIINGQTLDKFNKKLKSVEILNNLVKDYVIVDEVSMMKEIFYKMLSVIKMYKPHTKIILVGHSLQFSPVKDRIGEHTTDFYFNSDVFKELVDNNKLILTKCRRSDDKHYKNCSNVNNVNINDYGNKIADFNICYTNNKRIEINKILMDRVKEKNKIKKLVSLELPKFKFSKISQNVYLTIGTPIISIKNVKSLDFVNSEMFNIKKINKDDEIITISNLNKDIEIPFNKFQNWFHVAYCITSHKSQGQTINKPYTIHDWDRMDETCKYVSLSRASKFEYVNIIE